MSRRLSILGLAIFALAAPLAGQEVVPPPAVVREDAYTGPPVSPRGAFLRSLVIPGWGQAYVGAPTRGAVYFSLAGGSLWMTYVARRQLHDARRELAWQQEIGVVAPTVESEFVLARGRHLEDWAALSIFLFFLSGADAYVAAYLSDFQDRIGVLPGNDGTLRIEARLPGGWSR